MIGLSRTRVIVEPRTARALTHAVTVFWLLVTAFSLLLPSLPDLGDSFRRLPLPVDKVAHFLLFFVCCWVLHRSLEIEQVSRPLLGAAVLSLLYGLITEVLQLVIPNRNLEPLDGFANGLAVLAYVAVLVANRSLGGGHGG